MEHLIFFLLAAVTVFGALNVALRKNPVIGALNLVLTILALAGLYLTLQADFLAAVQIIVYAGAIMVLFLFVIFLINLDREVWEDFSVFKVPPLMLGAAFVVTLVLLVGLAQLPDVPERATSPDPGSGSEVGKLLFTKYVFPFEIVSIILFIGMIGAIVLAMKKKVR